MSSFFQCEVQWWFTNLSKTKGRSVLTLIFVMLKGHQMYLVWWKSLFSRAWSRRCSSTTITQTSNTNSIQVLFYRNPQNLFLLPIIQLAPVYHILTHHICTVTSLRELQCHHRCGWTGIPELRGTEKWTNLHLELRIHLKLLQERECNSFILVIVRIVQLFVKWGYSDNY